jgi:adenosylcobinamide-GDP ribazoletransferase
VLTGALHLDALADTADALGASSRADALRIMRDPTTGAFGTAAVALVLLIEAGALAELARRGSLAPVVAAFALSRAVAPALACLLAPARSGPSLATTFTGAQRRRRAAAAVALGAAIAVACGPRSAPWLLLAATAVWIVAFVTARRRFGGATGDVLGAAIAVTAAACLAVATAA